ncbi:MAG TPA: HlyD family efflux transporter periplasmic adaptor subunit [Chitinophagaceae bacterium]
MQVARLLFFSIVLIIAASCHHKEQAVAEDTQMEVQTPVTVTGIQHTLLEEYVELNATSTWLQSSFIKASANGYLKSVNLKIGQHVNAGQLAFTLKTKEAHALGNMINALDSSFRFSGMIRITSSVNGYVQELNHQPGDYVQDGEQLAVISDAADFGFLLNLPYELRRVVSIGQSLDILLPDGTRLKGVISSVLPNVDTFSQTLAVMLRVNAGTMIPQNLVAKVRITKTALKDVPSLPKEAVLTDEAQTNFWVMKMIDTVTAVKVPVIKGMQTGDRVEIISPGFAATDKILLTGNYGLPDTAKVKIISSVQ